MKFNLISIFCFILAFNLLGQSSTTYNKSISYYGSPNNTSNKILSSFLVDSIIYLAVGTVDYTNGQQACIVAVDDQGNELNKLYLRNPDGIIVVYPGESMIVDSDSNILLVGDFHSLQGVSSYIVKVTKDLDTLWTRTFDIPWQLAGCPSAANVVEYFTAIRQTDDGGYLVAGNYRSGCNIGSTHDRLFLIKLDILGAVVWRRVYPNINSVYSMKVGLDSGFYVTASINLSPTGGALVRFNDQGDYLWHVVVNNDVSPSYPMDFTFVDNGKALVASATWIDYPQTQDRSFVISGVDLNTQQLVFEKEYNLFRSFESSELHQSVSLLTLQDQSVIACSNVLFELSSDYGVHRGMLFKMNSNGDSIWSRTYQHGNEKDITQFNDVIDLGDNTLLGLGDFRSTTIVQNTMGWLVRIDSNGYAPGAHPTGIQKPPVIVSNVNMYPNPSHDRTWLEFDHKNLAYTEGVLTLSDISGKQVLFRELNAGENRVEINLDGLKSGLYIVNVFFENGKTFSKKLVKSN